MRDVKIYLGFSQEGSICLSLHCNESKTILIKKLTAHDIMTLNSVFNEYLDKLKHKKEVLK